MIELIIRDEEGLSREIVKHLNTIEERILDCFAWQTDSPIWTLFSSKELAPAYADVALPSSSNSPFPNEFTHNNTLSNKCSAKRHLNFNSNDSPAKGKILLLFYFNLYCFFLVKTKL